MVLLVRRLTNRAKALFLWYYFIGGKKRMEEQKNVPYFIHEGMMARDERTIKRLILALMITVALLVISNMAWLYVWQQYEYVEENIDLVSRDGGNANYIWDDGDIVNGGN